MTIAIELGHLQFVWIAINLVLLIGGLVMAYNKTKITMEEELKRLKDLLLKLEETTREKDEQFLKELEDLRKDIHKQIEELKNEIKDLRKTLIHYEREMGEVQASVKIMRDKLK